MTALEFQTTILDNYRLIHAVVVRIVGNENDAADIVQELARRLWEQHESLTPPERPQAFCATVARNAALDFKRHASTRHTVPLDTMPDPANIADETVIDNTNILYRAISLLPDNRRRVVTLSLKGLSSSAIAKQLDISEVNTRQLLSRARHQLHSLINSLLQQQ